MSALLTEESIICPYCSETITVLLDYSAGQQDYYEDCPVCCRPIRLLLCSTPEGNDNLNVMREDEA